MSDARRALHLCFINEFFWPDVCASSAVLTDHLPRIRGLRPQWRITVIAGNRAWDRPDVTWPARESWRGIDIIRVPRAVVGRGLWARGRGFLDFHRGVASAARHLDRPDVIVASTAPPLGGRLGAKLAGQFGSAHIYKALDLYPECAEALGVIRPGGLTARVWRRIDAAAMRRSAAVVGISRGIVGRIEQTRGLPAGRVRLIHDGFDPDRVRYVPREQNRFMAERGLSGRFVVQYAGNMGRSHPMKPILEAATLLRGDARMLFQFIGVGPGRADVLAAIEEGSTSATVRPVLRGDAEGVVPGAAEPTSPSPSWVHEGSAATRDLTSRPSSIQLLDYQPADRLAEVLSAADIAIISQAAGMAELSLPYKLYGILAAARPFVFIGPAESEIVDLCRQTGCGVHVATGDAASLARAIRSLRDDHAARAEMGRRGRALFESQFSSAVAAEQWVELIESLTP